MGTYSLIIHIKTKYVYKEISDYVDKRFDTSDHEVNRPLPTGKNEKLIGIMKDKLGRQIIIILLCLD